MRATTRIDRFSDGGCKLDPNAGGGLDELWLDPRWPRTEHDDGLIRDVTAASQRNKGMSRSMLN